jgi:hypothetical protein
MSTKTRQVIWGGKIMGVEMRAAGAREAAQKAIREADRAEAEGVVGAHGRLRRTGAAVTDHWPISKWWAGLAGGRMPSLQDAGKPTSRRHPPTARHAALEVGGFAEMPIMPEGSSRAAGAHDQADGNTGDHALQVGTSG